MTRLANHILIRVIGQAAVSVSLPMVTDGILGAIDGPPQFCTLHVVFRDPPLPVDVGSSVVGLGFGELVDRVAQLFLGRHDVLER